MQIVTDTEVKLHWITPNAEAVIAEDARIAYLAEPKGADGELIKKLLAMKPVPHESPCDHAFASFHIITDRGVTHEIVRHRIAAYMQESTRFCNYAKGRYGKEITLHPMNQGLTDAQIARRMKHWKATEELYLAEIEEGIKPQQARDNLPTCLKAKIAWTASFTEWRHVLRMRSFMNPHAHPQMHKVAEQIRAILKREAPAVFEDR